MSPRCRSRSLSLSLSLIATASLAMPLAGQSPDPSAAKVLVNTDKQGLALEGHDPVAFFTEARAVQGNSAHTATWQGATYRFTSAEHRAAFAAEPAMRTAPATSRRPTGSGPALARVPAAALISRLLVSGRVR